MRWLLNSLAGINSDYFKSTESAETVGIIVGINQTFNIGNLKAPYVLI